MSLQKAAGTGAIAKVECQGTDGSWQTMNNVRSACQLLQSVPSQGFLALERVAMPVHSARR